jgi:NAD(P)-dependent dehydrogenase (short-subunit alcohol dehydrogenase family)
MSRLAGEIPPSTAPGYLARMSSTIKTALVTGGTRGLGLELVLQLARSGALVYTVARRRRQIDLLRRTATAEKLPIVVLQGDLIALGTPRRIARRLAKDGIGLDLMVHNAGLLGLRAPLSDWSRREFDRVIAANLSAPFDLTRRLLPRLGGGSRVVFVSSGVTIGIRRGWGAYQVSKVAMENLALTFAAELGEGGPIVAIFNPGPMRTAMRAAAYPEEDPTTMPEPAVVAAELLELVENLTVQQHGGSFAAKGER